MVHVIYYVPSIPNVKSTARYAHATAFLDNVDSATLITETDPPDELANRYDSVYILTDRTLGNAQQAAKIANNATDEQILYVTSFHYAPVLSGARADLPWVVDVYDNPIQYALNDPRSYHQLTARGLMWLIGRADGVIHDYHPYKGRVMGSDPRFILEGCPIDLIDPTYKLPDESLECVWAGSPRLERGMKLLIDALEMVEGDITVSVYGKIDEEIQSVVDRRGLAKQIHLHGWTEHEKVLEAVSQAHVGLCVLPDRQDWHHSTPLKVREYMAGGTVPVMSDFPGMRYIAESTGIYTSPTKNSLASTIDQLLEFARLTPESFVDKMRKSRHRAEAHSLDRSNEWFVRQCVSSGLGIELL